MKNRIFAIVLVLALCALPLFSCSGETVTAASLYKSATDALSAAQGLEAKMTLSMANTYEGETESMDMEYTVKINGDDIEIDAKMDMFGEEMEIRCIYVDGYLYGEAMGQKVKGECDPDYLTDDMFSDMGLTISKPEEMIGDDLPALTEEHLKDVELKTESDGSYSFTVTLTKDQIKDLPILQTAPDEISLKDISSTFTFSKDKVLTSCETKFTADDEGEVTTVSYKIEFVNLGSAPTITAPANPDEYTEMEF